jgi:YggT family protein
MNQALSGAGLFLVQAVFTIASFAVLARFILQAVRADFYNPITQAIVRITDPVLKPLRKVIPSAGGLDLAALLVVIVLQVLLVFVMFGGIGPFTAVVLSSFRLLMLVLDIYFWSLIIIVILSWVAPQTRHPGAELLHQVTEPLVAPFRRLIPPMGGLDFSVLVVFLVLTIVREYLVPGLAAEVGIPRGALY